MILKFIVILGIIIIISTLDINFLSIGKCPHCGHYSNIFKKCHKRCELIYKQGVNKYIHIINNAIIKKKRASSIESRLNKVCNSNYIKNHKRELLGAIGFEMAFKKIQNYNSTISYDYIKTLHEFREYFKLDRALIKRNKNYLSFVKANLYYDLIYKGSPTQWITFKKQPQFIFQKSDKTIWVFDNVNLYKELTKSAYIGSLNGANIRIMKGVYYRFNSYKGQQVKYEENKYISTGTLVFTTKNIYYSSEQKTFKMAYSKLISIGIETNKIRIYQNNPYSKPLMFTNFDTTIVSIIRQYINNNFKK